MEFYVPVSLLYGKLVLSNSVFNAWTLSGCRCVGNSYWGPGRPRVRRESSNVSLPSPSPASQSDAPLLPTVHHYGFFIIMEFFALVSLLYGIFCSSFIALWKICNLFHIIPPPSVRYLDTSSVICMMLFLEFLLPSAVVVVRADQPLQIGVLFRW